MLPALERVCHVFFVRLSFCWPALVSIPAVVGDGYGLALPHFLSGV